MNVGRRFTSQGRAQVSPSREEQPQAVWLTSVPLRLRDGSVVLVSSVPPTDGRDHVAIAAKTAQGELVGVARFVRDPSERRAAAVVVSVVERWRRRGVGSYLVGLLRAAALDVGIRTFTGHAPEANAAIRKLLARAGDGLALVNDADTVRIRLDGGPT